MECAHKKEQVHIEYNSAADRPPAVWICECGASWTKDPNNPNGVTYLDHPNPKHTKLGPRYRANYSKPDLKEG